MAYEIKIGAGDPLFLCSIGSWTLFTRWAATLSGAVYPALHQLAERGRHGDALRVQAELEVALETEPPTDAGIKATARHLQKLLDDYGDDGDAVQVVD